jgi:enoyl-CoA hydratase
MTDPVLVSRSDRSLIITLNRPHVRNAINGQSARQLAAALRQLDSSPDVLVGILTGAGGTFCSGMDLRAFAEGELPDIAGQDFGGLTRELTAKPLIAAVEGWALAGGMELVLACDLAVAGRTARFGLPEVKRGLVAAGGGALRLPHRLPAAIAMELLLTGEPIPAERAASFGLLNQVVPDGQALSAALRLAAVIAGNAPMAVQATKAIALRASDWSQAEQWSQQQQIAGPVLASEDAREGAAAFAGRRPPVWQGR